jgi:hypothetical protein
MQALTSDSKASVWPYLIGWTLLNLIQAGFTELFHDEAHYWMFSQHLAWGYWDHPPATPFLIFLGSSILPGELGARLFIVLASTVTVYFLYRLVQPKDQRLFFAMIFSVFLLHVGGFMAAPDITLVFFASAFLLAYRRYLADANWKNALLLGVLTAGLAYSKYHGALFLLFLFLPNWKLIRKPTFWLIPLLALVLFLPHLAWQYEYDFPTFRYHLIDRGAEPHEWQFIPAYLGGQLLVFGPLMGFILLWGAFKQKATNDFERSLKWCFIGLLGFFFYRSFFERTEANWTATALFPIIYLAYHYVESRASWRKWVYRLAWPSLLLVLVFRIFLIWDFLPEKMNARNEFHNWDVWAQELSELADTLPIVFYNTYRGPSKYQFYAGKEAHAINIWSHSGNQYDLMRKEEEALQGRRVLLVSGHLTDGTAIQPGHLQNTYYKVVDDFRSYNRLRIKVYDAPEQLRVNEEVYCSIELINPTDQPVDFSESSRNVKLQYHVYDGERVARRGDAIEFPLTTTQLLPGERISLTARVKAPAEPGSYRFRYTIHVDGLHNGRQANFYDVEVVAD